MNDGELRRQYIIGRMEQGYNPWAADGGGGCGCLGFILALAVVVTVFSFIAGLGLDLVHLVQHLLHRA